MRFLIRTTVSAVVCLSAASTVFAEPGVAPSPTTRAGSVSLANSSGPDSIIFERLPKDRVIPAGMKLVRMHKWERIGQGALLDSVFTRIQKSGYSELSSAQIANACGNPGTTVGRWSIRVLSNGAWREVIVPDDCIPSSPALAAQLSGLNKVGWDLFMGHLR